MNASLIRIEDLASTKDKTGLLPVSPATVWRWVREGKFPKPFKIGARVTVWSAADVDAHIKRLAESSKTDADRGGHG